jgi:hypothetical protein
MAIDNLNYYSAWLPAWQQTDKYSSQPWCLKSKNLDIFSSSKSVKATAFSEPVAWEGWVVKEEWWLVLKTDWKIYTRSGWIDTLFIDPNTDMPKYQVDYTWTWSSYSTAIWGTPMDMTVKSEWGEWKSFVAFTDRASLTYSKAKRVINKTFDTSGFETSSTTFTDWYRFTKPYNYRTASVTINIDNVWFWGLVPIRIRAQETVQTDCHISISSITMYYSRYKYDYELDSMSPSGTYGESVSYTWELISLNGVQVWAKFAPNEYDRWINISFDFTPVEWGSSYDWTNNYLYIDINWWPAENHKMRLIDGTMSDWDYNYYYSYLPLRERELVPVWEYYWLKWATFQPLYNWQWERISILWTRYRVFDFVQYMWWENDSAMDVIWMISWNEQVYMIGNMNGNWYIIPCDYTWGRWTPYVAYWCTFLGVENIDYLLYLVWEDRGISTLWVFNQQELVPIIWGNKENTSTDLVWVDEQYKFDWKIVNWRKNLILTTKDNRIFQYWQTYGGKWWAFIHQLPANAVIKSLKANWNDLEINYSITVNDTTTNYSIKYQDDTPMKRYNTEWSATYPIVLWNHILEKEESDLYTSFILPSASTKLEFWGMANHYHFWTFTSEDNATLSESESYKIKWTSWTYALKFIERNDNQYTFRLEWDLPVQTSSEMKITDSNNTVVLNYTDFNHFRKIWTIETDKYLEWEFRFHNLNNKLELPKSHSLQIMVKGKGTTNYTPELFSLDLVANQRERW